jgi:hypothetical protein
MKHAVLVLLTIALAGCSSKQSPPAEDLPPAYPRGQINDPKLAESARDFVAWARAQQSEGKPLYERIETLPPVDTVLPYGIGTYQRERRLPALLTTGPGWNALSPPQREEAAASAFQELTRRVAASSPGLKATLTVQTPDGVELGWINHLTPGRNLLHGN